MSGPWTRDIILLTVVSEVPVTGGRPKVVAVHDIASLRKRSQTEVDSRGIIHKDVYHGSAE